MTVYRSTVYSCRQTDITGVYHLKEKYLRFLRKCEHAVLTELESVRLHSGGEEKFCVTNLGFRLIIIFHLYTKHKAKSKN